MTRHLYWSDAPRGERRAVGFRGVLYCVEPCTDYETGHPVHGWALTVNGEHLGTWLVRDAAMSAASAHNEGRVDAAWSDWRQRALSEA